MRIMIAVVASVLSIAILSPSGAGQTRNKLEASVNEPVTH